MKSLETRLQALEAVVAAVESRDLAEIRIYRLGEAPPGEPASADDLFGAEGGIVVWIPYNGRES